MTEAVERRRTAPWREHSRSSAGVTLRPPTTDRGVQITTLPPEYQLTVQLHEVTGTTRCTVDEVLGTFQEFGVPLKEQSYGSRIYKRRWLGPLGVTVQADNKMRSDELHVRIPGEACDSLGLENLVAVSTLLNLDATRVDAAVDGAPFKPAHLQAARRAGMIRTHAQTGRFIIGDEGDTFYLGSKNSDMQLRCYDMRGPTRVELQLRRGVAKNFLAALFASGVDDLPKLALGAIRGFVDFVDSRSNSNTTRCTLLPFWSSFIGLFPKIRLATRKSPSSVERSLQYLRKQAAMLVTYVQALHARGTDPFHALEELLKHGQANMKDRHHFLVHAACATA